MARLLDLAADLTPLGLFALPLHSTGAGRERKDGRACFEEGGGQVNGTSREPEQTGRHQTEPAKRRCCAPWMSFVAKSLQRQVLGASLV